MKTIIRIESTVNGLGIFWGRSNGRTDTVWTIASQIARRHQEFPTPENDYLLYMDKDSKKWFCAYKSIEQLQQWIKPEEFQILFNNNYKVLLLDVTEYQEGEYQIIYTKESILNSKDISSLFK